MLSLSASRIPLRAGLAVASQRRCECSTFRWLHDTSATAGTAAARCGPSAVFAKRPPFGRSTHLGLALAPRRVAVCRLCRVSQPENAPINRSPLVQSGAVGL